MTWNASVISPTPWLGGRREMKIPAFSLNPTCRSGTRCSKELLIHSVCRASFLIHLATIEDVISNRPPVVESVGHPPVVLCELPDGIHLVYTDYRGRRRAI